MSLPDGMSTNGAPPSGKFSPLKTEVLPFPRLPTGHHRRSQNVVVTWIAGESARRWFSVTGPAMARYATAIGADFVVLEGYTSQPYPLANKFRVKQLFDEYQYQRALYIDADILVTPEAENLFESVPEDKVAMLDEGNIYDYWMLAHYRYEAIELMRSQGIPPDNLDIPSPKNAGLYLMPKAYADALRPPSDPFPLCYRNGATVEQTWFCLMLEKHGAPIHPLKFPDQHWLWYLDQRERSIERGQFLHFCGLQSAGEFRFERLTASAVRLVSRHQDIVNHETRASPLLEFDRQMILDHQAPPALRIEDPFVISSQQYGWEVAIKAISVLSNPDGVLFDGFIERTFLWQREDNRQSARIPYREPWLGVVHHPPDIPSWASIARHRLQDLDEVPEWRTSLDACIGLYALTENLAEWVQGRWGISCEVVRYPALTPAKTFCYDQFVGGEHRTVATIGFWLRRYSTFMLLLAPGYSKIRPLLVEDPNSSGVEHIRAYERDELKAAGLSNSLGGRVKIIPRLSNEDYDELLATSVIFLDLIAAAGVTTLVECLARGTPLLINSLPGVREYLGGDYPLYYGSIQEAESKLQDKAAIRAAHDHMLANPIRELLKPQEFLNSIAASNGYGKALWTISRNNGHGCTA